MTWLAAGAGLWAITCVAVLLAIRSSVRASLREDAEVAALDATWALPAFDEGIHA